MEYKPYKRVMQSNPRFNSWSYWLRTKGRLFNRSEWSTEYKNDQSQLVTLNVNYVYALHQRIQDLENQLAVIARDDDAVLSDT